MNDQQLLRYSRHILLPEIGIEGQERLRAGAALIVGAGGLGCPAALYLAAAGIGHLVLADSDQVDLTNLQRQILYRTNSVGAPKVDAARSALNELNPDVALAAVKGRVDQQQAEELVARADVVLDCSDNFPTRHALNRACVKHAKPLVSGAAIRFEATLKQALRLSSDGDAAGRAATLLRYAIGCLHQYAKSGFSRKPTESFTAQRRYLLA